MKVCSKCGVEKIYNEYSKDRSTLLGIKSQCKECRKSKSKEYYKENPEAHKIRSTRWRGENKDRFRNKQNEYIKKRRKVDPTFRLSKVMKQHVHRVLQEQKTLPTELLTGYSAQDLREHIESLWEDWMSWDNYGTEWVIDHKYPVSQYLKDGIFDSNIINALDNLQPMERIANLIKGSNV